MSKEAAEIAHADLKQQHAEVSERHKVAKEDHAKEQAEHAKTQTEHTEGKAKHADLEKQLADAKAEKDEAVKSAVSTEACDMTVGTDTTILMPSPTSTTSTTDRVTVKTAVAAYVTTDHEVDHTRGQEGVMAGCNRVVVNGSGNVGSMTKVRLGLLLLVAHLAICT